MLCRNTNGDVDSARRLPLPTMRVQKSIAITGSFENPECNHSRLAACVPRLQVAASAAPALCEVGARTLRLLKCGRYGGAGNGKKHWWTAWEQTNLQAA